ncbi:MAG: hypothetical protein KME21_31290 [Desmonostoc vinosum HA7617-LM4]|jgi:hypothetical protein|nr:hypothetical protein [Desmonostoc vinosum HA7617-LM4]
MPYKRRTYRVLEKVELRVAGLKAIDPHMDFGDTCNLQNLIQLIERYRSKIDAHNTALAVIDSFKAEMNELQQTLAELSEKMLIGVAFKYGKDSREYEMAGAVRKSDRIRKIRAARSKTVTEETSDEKVQTT